MKRKRPSTARWQFGIRGASLTIRHLMLYRDIHYRSEDGKHATRSEYRLGADEYFRTRR